MTGPHLIAAHQTIRLGSRSFAMAARLLELGVRDDAVLLYAWCRHCDDAVDGQALGGVVSPVSDPAAVLDALRGFTEDALSGRPAPAPFAGLAEVCERRAIPATHPGELLNGFAMDVQGRRYETLGDTLDYCYHAAGAVGVMMAMVMGARGNTALDRASDLGIAFQLTNIARDVVEDARAGRCYLPADMLAARGLTADDLRDPAAWPHAQAVALELLDVAERYYASGLVGLASLPRGSVWGIAAARRIYRSIGTEIRRASPEAWAARVSTGTWRKLTLVGLAVGDGLRARGTAPTARDQLWSRPDDGIADDAPS